MKCRLRLIAKESCELELDMEESIDIIASPSNITDGLVYSDKIYTVQIDFKRKIDNIEFYVNDTFKECSYTNNTIHFKDRLFTDYFGYVIISINIKSGSKEYILTSKYIDVAIKENILSDNIRKMISYIMENCDRFLNLSGMKSRDFASLEQHSDNMETQLEILKNIIFEYDRNYRFFKLNSKFHINSNERLDSFEKVVTISSNTIKHIITNPQELHKVNINTGIKYNNQYLLPKKTLISKNVDCCDIYENKVVLGFLKSLYQQVNNNLKLLDEKIRVKNSTQAENSYFSSAEEMERTVLTDLHQHKKDLEIINMKIQKLFTNYKAIINCNEIPANSMPKPTKIFTTVTHYRKIYNVISKWFKRGNYEFKKEDMLISFIGNSQIYEYYILLKLNNYFINNNFEMESMRRHIYDMDSTRAYKQAECENVFTFKKPNSRVTVYYQPVISHMSLDDNNIGLFRNNDINFYGRRINKTYYTPDYVIKKVEDGVASYTIVDAKFSDINTVKKKYLLEIVYKYLFSISTVNERDTIKKFCIINGKSCSEGNGVHNIYNSDYSERNETIAPSLKALTITPDADESEHMKNLDQLFKV